MQNESASCRQGRQSDVGAHRSFALLACQDLSEDIRLHMRPKLPRHRWKTGVPDPYVCIEWCPKIYFDNEWPEHTKTSVSTPLTRHERSAVSCSTVRRIGSLENTEPPCRGFGWPETDCLPSYGSTQVESGGSVMVLNLLIWVILVCQNILRWDGMRLT